MQLARKATFCNISCYSRAASHADHMQLNHGCLLKLLLHIEDIKRAQAAHLCSSCHVLQLDIPVVLSICQFSPIQLATLQLHLQEQVIAMVCSPVLTAKGASTTLLHRLTDRTWPSDSCSSFTGMPTPLEEAILGRATPLPLSAQQRCQPSGPAGDQPLSRQLPTTVSQKQEQAPWSGANSTKKHNSAGAGDYWNMQAVNTLTCR